ncbi:MAG: CoA ester lyase [Betaproteobacteria bacterium]|nr:CoA ester lyase [Betaproteobacteria bacterium]
MPDRLPCPPAHRAPEGSSPARSGRLAPQAALYGRDRPLPALAPCVHYAGSERFIAKALALQGERRLNFDVAADCEDGAPVGGEREHARMIARLIAGDGNRCDRAGARIHDLSHPAWRDDLEILVGECGDRLAFLTLPKAESADDVLRFADAVALGVARRGLGREIPLAVMIETHGAVHDAWRIAAVPGLVSLDFGTLDFVSAHHGAIPAAAMESPGQFDHRLLRRAKCETAAAALAHAVVPAHGVTRALDDPQAVFEDARRARQEFGFLRMWSIHPSQIEPIVRAMQPSPAEISEAAAVLAAAQAADWAPLAAAGKLHDRGSYRYFWSVLQRAHAAGSALPESAAGYFDATHD